MDKIKLVCFDINKTLIKENTWEDLNVAMGMSKEEDELLFNLHEEGIINYKQWQELLVRIYKSRGKATVNNIDKIIKKYTFVEGAKDLVGYLKKKYELTLITGSINMLAEHVAGELGINSFEANNIFMFDENDYLVDIVVLGGDEDAKFHHLQSFCRKFGIKLTECACIGDGDNDIKLFKETKTRNYF